MHDNSHGSDMKAAFTGLILGAIAILILVVTIVKLTNHRYESEKPAAEATH